MTSGHDRPRVVRHFVLPGTLRGKLHAWRFVIARRSLQVATLLLFFGTLHWGWSIAGRPLLAGNLTWRRQRRWARAPSKPVYYYR